MLSNCKRCVNLYQTGNTSIKTELLIGENVGNVTKCKKTDGCLKEQSLKAALSG